MTGDHLFCFGLGYSARVLARRLLGAGWTVTGTARTDEQVAALRAEGFAALRFDRDHPLPPGALAGVTHIVVSIPPDAEGDPVLAAHGAELAAAEGLRWIGYLSTTGVYGDRGGDRVDEGSALTPSNQRSWRRLHAEQAWLALWHRHRRPVHVFRLAGIYGPGRSPLEKLRQGRARRVVKPGQVFCRIHVEDLATVLAASMARPDPGAVYNVADDRPAPPQDVIAHAAELLGVPAPPEIAFEDAEMSAMERSFYADSKRVDNSRIKRELGVRLAYPDYKAGLAAILAAEANPEPKAR